MAIVNLDVLCSRFQVYLKTREALVLQLINFLASARSFYVGDVNARRFKTKSALVAAKGTFR